MSDKDVKLIVALDVNNAGQARHLADILYPKVRIFKVGLRLYTACGPRIVKDIQANGADVFLDLKLNDIPNTMAEAVEEAVKYKVAMLTVHTLSGPEALKAVSRVAKGSKTRILGVTILTSISPHFLNDLKIQRTLSGEAQYLAKMAKRCGLDGVVCSVHEAKQIRKACGKDFIIVTPGVRPEGTQKHDQKRTATPQEARKAGANFIVVGRPILEARDPLMAAQEIISALK